MSKTITLRLNDQKYELLKKYAELDNRAISNFIETAALRYISEIEMVDEFEMEEINSNKELLSALKNGVKDSKSGRRNKIA